MKNRNRKRFYVRKGVASWARHLYGVADRAGGSAFEGGVRFVGYFKTRTGAEKWARVLNAEGYKEKVWFDGDGEASYR